MQDDMQPKFDTPPEEPNEMPVDDMPTTGVSVPGEVAMEASNIEQPSEPVRTEEPDIPNQEFSGEELDALKVEQDTSLDATAMPEEALEQAPNEMTDTTTTPIIGGDDMAAVGTDMAMSAAQPAMVVAGKKSKKGLIIGIVVAIIAVLGIGGGVAAYSLWYQNPDKVIGDGLKNALTAESVVTKGTLSYVSDSGTFSLETDIKAASDGSASIDAKVKLKVKQIGDTEFTIPAQAVFSKDADVYIKFTDVQKVFETAMDSYLEASITNQYALYGQKPTPQDIEAAKKEAMKSFTPIVKAIDNQWIVFKADDIDKYNESDSSFKCVTDTFKKLDTNDTYNKEIADAYKNNIFIEVKEKLGVKDGSIGYVVDFNKDAAKKFGDAVENTEFGKELKKCDDDKSSSTNDSDSDDDSDTNVERAELWIDQWSHEITRFTLESKTKDDSASKGTLKLDITTDFGTDVKVTIPSDAKTIDELKKEFQGLGGGAATGLL